MSNGQVAVQSRNAKYRQEHPEEIKAYNRAHYQRNRDAILERGRERYATRKRLLLKVAMLEDCKMANILFGEARP